MACTVPEHFSDFEKLIREPRYSADTSLESVPPIVGSGGADRGSGRKADQRRTAEVEYHRGRGAEADRGRVV